jgi:uncharacterized protein YkwD
MWAHWLLDHRVIQAMLKLTNRARSRHGIQPLILDMRLCLDAQKHARWMARNWYGHSTYQWAECIHTGCRSAAACIADWIHSPPHFDILTIDTDRKRRAGFGYEFHRGQTWWVAEVAQ